MSTAQDELAALREVVVCAQMVLDHEVSTDDEDGCREALADALLEYDQVRVMKESIYLSSAKENMPTICGMGAGICILDMFSIPIKINWLFGLTLIAISAITFTIAILWSNKCPRLLP